MAVEIITKEDLQIFRLQLLEEIKTLLQPKLIEQKQWLKSSEVRRLLKISPGTLQNLRINGTLSFTRIGSIIYYNYNDIQSMLDAHKTEAVTENTLFGKIRKGDTI